MEPNGLNGGMFSSMSSGLLGVENPLQQQQKNLTNPQNSQHLQHHPQMVPYASHHDTDTIHHHQQQHQQSMKHGYPPYSTNKNKQQQQSTTTLSDEDEPGVAADDNSPGDPKRKVSPWQRMKWTDTMVRLLIMAVYYIGDEAGSEGTDPSGKKRSSGLLQKKGKWKSVSRAMMEKGFYVSPQQCEDKFNDLNKRYKRVNDILGKGTACRVVENQNLLDTMELSPKMKEEVRKLLNSKHLFFREMCVYHNSCGHGGSSTVPHQIEAGIEVSQSQASQPQQLQQQQKQRGCFHSSENEGLRMLKVGNGEENYDDDDDDVHDHDHDHDEDDEDEDESEDYSDGVENESGEGGSRGHHGNEDEDENDGRPLRKRPRKASGSGSGSGLGLGIGSSMSSQLMQQLSNEMNNVCQDGGKSPWEKKQWMRSRILQLEEQQISYHTEAFEMEKQRLKWARFSSKKEREMERAKLENERRRLENERMVLLIRQKELELVKLQKQQQQQQHSSTLN